MTIRGAEQNLIIKEEISHLFRSPPQALQFLQSSDFLKL